MMDEPSAAELADVVASFLRSALVPAVRAPLAFDVRVAANALDLLARELRLGPEGEREETSRLTALVGHGGERDALNRELCRAIGEGGLDLSDARLRDHLRATTLAKLAIDQPTYATYRTVVAAGWDAVRDEPWPDEPSSASLPPPVSRTSP